MEHEGDLYLQNSPKLGVKFLKIVHLCQNVKKIEYIARLRNILAL